MASSGGIWGLEGLRYLRAAVANTTKVIRNAATDAAKPVLVQPAPIRSKASHRAPAALVGQAKQGVRWFSAGPARNIDSLVRPCTGPNSTAAARFDRSNLPRSVTSQRVSQFSGRAPFASTLRPNLTGGAMPRTAGGYSLAGGSARYFSHTPAAPAQVVQNVSQAMRAFFVSGQRTRYDGTGPRGEARYRAVSPVEHEALRKLADIPRFAPGAHIDFQLSPTITALGPLAATLVSAGGLHGELAVVPSLNTDGFLDVLSADFGRALKDLTAVYADIQRLSALGDLPITLQGGAVLRVRFPGSDAETVERLCQDIGIQRGFVGQDRDLGLGLGANAALRFPFAPDTHQSLSSSGGSVRSLQGLELEDTSSLGDESYVHDAFVYQMDENPWVSETDGFESMSHPESSEERDVDEHEGLEGIHRFLEECDRAKGRLR